MEHILRVLVRIDTKSSTASVEVRGCLVQANWEDLLEILRHTASLGTHVVVNLTKAQHLEATAMDQILLRAGQVPCLPLDGGHTTVSVRVPSRLPSCEPPRLQVPWNLLSNAQAFELAFRQHDPAVLRPARQPG